MTIHKNTNKGNKFLETIGSHPNKGFDLHPGKR